MTTTTTTKPAETTQLYQVFIKASPERIWKAITRPEDTSRYFHGSHVEAELRVGGKFWYHSPDKSKLWGDGEVLELDEPKRLVTSWHALWDDETAKEKASRVIWEIRAAGRRLLQTHRGARPARGSADHGQARFGRRLDAGPQRAEDARRDGRANEERVTGVFSATCGGNRGSVPAARDLMTDHAQPTASP